MTTRSDLRIGVARRDITPPQPEFLRPTGMERLEPTRGVLDPLYAEAMAVETGGERLLVVTSDLRTIQHDWVVEVREAVADRCGCPPERVLLSSTHNHCSSPEVGDDSPRAAEALAEANRKITSGMIEACAEAFQTRRPAEIACTDIALREPVGQNRRVRLSNGTCVNCWHGGGVCPPGHKYVGPGGPDSTGLRLLSVRAVGAAEPFAAFVSYPTHPHLTGIPYFSGETVGAAKREIEARRPGLLVLWANHTGGDVDVHCVHPMAPGGTEAIVRWFQESQRIIAGRLADAVVPALATCDGYERPATLRHAYWSKGEEDAKNRWVTILNVAVLGRFALASIPGELFLALGREAMARSPVPHLVMMGYNGSAGGYQPPALCFEQGSYEVMRGPAASEDDLLEARPGRFVRRAQTDSGHRVIKRLLDMLRRLSARRGKQ